MGAGLLVKNLGDMAQNSGKSAEVVIHLAGDLQIIVRVAHQEQSRVGMICEDHGTGQYGRSATTG